MRRRRRVVRSLEKIFIEERIYKDKQFEEAKSMDVAVAHVDKRLEPFKKTLSMYHADDILKLMEINGAILRFNVDKANELIARLLQQIEEIEHQLNHLIDYIISRYLMLKEKYGKLFRAAPR